MQSAFKGEPDLNEFQNPTALQDEEMYDQIYPVPKKSKKKKKKAVRREVVEA